MYICTITYYVSPLNSGFLVFTFWHFWWHRSQCSLNSSLTRSHNNGEAKQGLHQECWQFIIFLHSAQTGGGVPGWNWEEKEGGGGARLGIFFVLIPQFNTHNWRRAPRRKEKLDGLTSEREGLLLIKRKRRKSSRRKRQLLGDVGRKQRTQETQVKVKYHANKSRQRSITM